MRGRTFTREFKLDLVLDLVRQIASGTKRPAQVCREHQLGESLLARWRREYDERGEAAFTPRVLDGQAVQASAEQRVAELERLCGQLARENAALKRPGSTCRRARVHLLRALGGDHAAAPDFSRPLGAPAVSLARRQP